MSCSDDDLICLGSVSNSANSTLSPDAESCVDDADCSSSPTSHSHLTTSPIATSPMANTITIPLTLWKETQNTVINFNKQIGEFGAMKKERDALLKQDTELVKINKLILLKYREDIMEMKQQCEHDARTFRVRLENVGVKVRKMFINVYEDNAQLRQHLNQVTKRLEKSQRLHMKEVKLNDELRCELSRVGAENKTLRDKLTNELFVGGNQTCNTCKARDRVVNTMQDQIVTKAQQVDLMQQQVRQMQNELDTHKKMNNILSKTTERANFENKNLKKELAEERSKCHTFGGEGVSSGASSQSATPVSQDGITVKTPRTPSDLPGPSDAKKPRLSPATNSKSSSPCDHAEITIVEVARPQKAVFGYTSDDWKWAHAQMCGYENLLTWYRGLVRDLVKEKTFLEVELVSESDKAETYFEDCQMRNEDKDILSTQVKQANHDLDRKNAELNRLAKQVKLALEEKDKEIINLKKDLTNLTASVKSYLRGNSGNNARV